MGTICSPPVRKCAKREVGKICSQGRTGRATATTRTLCIGFLEQLTCCGASDHPAGNGRVPEAQFEPNRCQPNAEGSAGSNRTSRISSRSASPAMASTDRHHLAQYPAAQTDLGWGPGAGPWNYRKVPEPVLTSLLAAVAKPNTIGSVDIVDFQPQTDQPSEDRHVVQDWTLQNGTWKFLAVFDGNNSDYMSPHPNRQALVLIAPVVSQVTRGARP